MASSLRRLRFAHLRCFGLTLSALLLLRCSEPADPLIQADAGDSIVLIGNNLCARMMLFGHVEAAVQLRHPEHELAIRNLCDAGDTPGFRPHPGRDTPWAFPGAAQFNAAVAQPTGSQGHFETPDQWLYRLEADVILAFFGYNESFAGEAGLATYRAELDAFIEHTLSQTYNGSTPPRLVLVSPIAFEDLSGRYDLPDGSRENANLSQYADAMADVAREHNIPFVDAFTPTRAWYRQAAEPLTIDGFQLTDSGYERFATLLADALFGEATDSSANPEAIRQAVLDKNWFWHNDVKIPNGVHVYGRRYEPFGPDNYPAELQKIRELTAIRDTAIWRTLAGEPYDVAAADRQTTPLPRVETNYVPSDGDEPRYRYGDEALGTFETAPGYEIELFASEQDFPDLANPVQLSFDNQGRLWVATMPSYPHYRPGDSRPNDKLIILEDTDGDGRADTQTTFADSLHLPIGFEIAPEGVYVSQGTHLVLLVDTDGDDHADRTEVLLSGFDDHDTHHAISAFTADPSGAIYMAEGVFLHSNVETPYGPVRATNGGFMRYNPQRRHLERTAQLSIPNPWGIAFDAWGQPFFAETSGPDVRWMLPGTVKPRYGEATHKSVNLIEDAHKVRPTSGLEFVSSRHFPDDVQGDLLINNTIGFLGTKQHSMVDDGTGFASQHRQDLVRSTDGNFRPVDMEFAPDGSLYLIDWHNVLIGHMQHNARDPLRDHVHGRVYRITYPSRPLVEPAAIADAPIATLLDNLTLPEYRTRYRTRRELRGRDPEAVLAALDTWVDNLDTSAPTYAHHLTEALWVTWGLNRIDADLLRRVLATDDFRARAAAVRVLRYAGDQVPDRLALLEQAATDPHGRVRLEAIVAASWLPKDEGLAMLDVVAGEQLDDWTVHAHEAAVAHLSGHSVGRAPAEDTPEHLAGAALAQYVQGREIYHRDAHCGTCHQPDGLGLPSVGFPPLAGTRWVTGDEERLIKLTLHGLWGPIEVQGRAYPGTTPMTAFGGLLDNDEVAAVLTYVRNSFGNRASPIDPATVRAVRASTADQESFYAPEDLLRQHPMEE